MGLSFLVAAGLIAVPVLIHIFNRTRYRRVNWAAMEFLLAAYRKTRRRLQLEHLILLALRILAMLFLAFAFFPSDIENAARSAMNWAGISLAQDAGGGTARHLVLVVDDTASMQYRDANRSSYERAIEQSASVLSGMRSGRDQVTLIRVSSVALSRDARVTEEENLQRLNREIRAMDPARAAELLARSKPGNGRGDMLSVIREAGRRVDSIDILREQPMVAIVTDFQQNEWDFAGTQHPNNKAFVDVMRGLQSRLAQVGQAVRFIDVGPRATSNYAVLSAELEDPIVGVGIPAKIRVKVGNFASGTKQPEEIELRYRINQGEARAFTVKPRVPAGETAVVSQEIPAFDRAGVHTIRVEITNKDPWDADNARVIATSVIAQLPIAIVSESENLISERSEAFFLYVALNISSGDGSGARVTPNQVSLITPKSLDEASRRLDEFAVIIIANMSSLPTTFIDRLEQYVSEGGGTVIFCMGDRVDTDKYNQYLWRDGQGVLPVPLMGAKGWKPEDPAAQRLTIVRPDVSPGSPLEMFGTTPSNLELLTATPFVREWMDCMYPGRAAGANERLPRLPEHPDPAMAPRVLASLNADGTPPLLIQRRHGRGLSLLWTTSAGNSWTTLWEADSAGLGIALFHDIVRNSAVGDRSRSNLEVGDHYVRNLADKEQTALGNDVMAPDGSSDRPSIRTLAEDRRQLVYSRTAIPGLYRLRFLVDVNGQTEAAREEVFSVAIPAVETDTSRIGGSPDEPADPKEALRKGLSGVEFSFESASRDTDAMVTPGGANRYDVWLLLVGLAAFFLLAEIGMSVWIGRRLE